MLEESQTIIELNFYATYSLYVYEYVHDYDIYQWAHCQTVLQFSKA